MKKILFLQLLPILSGVQNFMLHLIDGLDRAEYEIHVASFPGPDLQEALRQRNITHIPLPWIRREISLWDPICLLHLIYIINKNAYDVVHTNSSKPGFLGRIAASLCKTPIIVHTAHGTPFRDDQNPLVKRLYISLEALANRYCHKVVFVNHADRLRYLEMQIIQEAKATTIYNALPPAKFQSLDRIADARKYPDAGRIV
ncbi:MAG: glycosyltransferase, partial [Candidatus Cloacimonadaceae bacterium]|nr:glycosyltransferase [Candidatus Cloacimonadaceae bacterium]